MSISRALKAKIEKLSDDEKDRLVRMGWEDRTSFEAIHTQFDLSPNEFVRFMRTQLDKKAYDRWRRRATQQGQLKHEKKSGVKKTRFKSTRQSVDGITKGWK